MIVSAIVAAAENEVIGRDGDLPWNLPKDMRFFKETTMGHHVIMGRKNWESIPEKFRPLPGRTNLVVTRGNGYVADGATVIGSIEEALELSKKANEEEAFLIGGGQVYGYALEQDLVERIYLTRIHAKIEGDIKFPTFNIDEWVMRTQTYYPADEKHEFAFTICVLEKE